VPTSAYTLDHNNHKSLYIAVAEPNMSDILTYLHREDVEKEWKAIRDILKQGLRNAEKYMKCKVSDSANNMFEMRFTNKGLNDRIYCQERTIGKTKYIILVELFEKKKSQEIPKKIKSRIDTISKIDYEIK